MSIRVNNTLSGRKEEFVPRRRGEAAIYVCGVTPYDLAHLGNARPAVFWDVVRRYLRAAGFRVTFVTNFTDIDDKIIRRARESGREPLALSAEYARYYLEDLALLGVEPADLTPRVTEHLTEIIALIAALLQREKAYVVDGDVYFSISSFPGYGKLSKRTEEEMEAGARVEIDPRKHHPMDFALWKEAKPGEPAWDSPWGRGRPGWHIECSAMSLKYLGMGFDMHGGGEDLIFPHHENEIAQAEAANEGQFVRYWLHNAFITVDGSRMGKSMGNLRPIREVAGAVPGKVIRYWLLGTHYRQPVNFSEEGLKGAANGLERLELCRGVLQDWLKRPAADGAASPETAALQKAVALCRQQFGAGMEDDFNTAQALAALHELAREANRIAQDREFQPTAGNMNALGEVLQAFEDLGGILGLWFDGGQKGDEAEIEALVARRESARARKDWAEADRLRAELKERGVILEDSPLGARWRRA